MASPTIVRVLRPRAVFHYIPLRSAAEWIVMTMVVNKLPGFFGILAIFTGYHLNWLQFSHYIYSLLVLGISLWLMPALRTNDQPLRILCIAWLYVLDTLVNSIYTGLFGASWFIILAQHLNGNENSPNAGGNGANLPGGSTINDTAGFTDPEHNVTKVEVIVAPAGGILSGQEAVAYGSVEQGGSLGSAVFQSGSIASITVLCTLWLVRLYMCLIMLSYARSAVRQYILITGNGSGAGYSQTEDASLAENPFRPGREEGQGWRGKLGRALLKFPARSYWLGKDESGEEDEWVRNTQGRFGRNKLRIQVPAPGVGERERRARSGTGPPRPVKA